MAVEVKTKHTNVNVGLSNEAIEEIVSHLNKYLASLSVLYTKLHNYHWNVEGEHFFTMHEVLEELYNAVHEETDDVAERTLKIGGRPVAKLEDALKLSEIPEAESIGIDGADVANELIRDYKTLINELRTLIEVAGRHGDEGTVDDAVAFLKDKEKQVWMLTAFKQ
ncbi:MAG: Dps family protein [Spirochaetales bacterium]